MAEESEGPIEEREIIPIFQVLGLFEVCVVGEPCDGSPPLLVVC